MPTNVNKDPEARRKARVRPNYGQNAAGKWVRKKAWRDCDYIDGHLREFDEDKDILALRRNAAHKVIARPATRVSYGTRCPKNN